MTPQPPLASLRPLRVRSAARIRSPRRDAVPLVWRRPVRLPRPVLALVRSGDLSWLQTITFNLAATRDWRSLRERAVRERETVRREVLRWFAAPAAAATAMRPAAAAAAAPGQRLTFLLHSVLRSVLKTRAVPPPAPLMHGRRNGTADSASTHRKSTLGASAAMVYRRLASSVRSAAPATVRRSAPELAGTLRPRLRVLPPLPRILRAGLPPTASGRTPDADPLPVRPQPVARIWRTSAGAGGGFEPERTARLPASSAPLPAAARRARLELVWSRPETPAQAAANASGVARAAASGGGPAAPVQWYRSAAEAARIAPPSAPNVDRLVDEVVRRLDRIARDERARRGL